MTSEEFRAHCSRKGDAVADETVGGYVLVMFRVIEGSKNPKLEVVFTGDSCPQSTALALTFALDRMKEIARTESTAP